MEHGSLENLDEARIHETTEITTFHEYVDRDATIENQNCIVEGVAIEMPEGCLTNGTTHSQRRLEGNCVRTSLLSLKKRPWWFNYIQEEGKSIFKEIERWFSRKLLQDVDENDIIARIGHFISKMYNEEYKIEDVIEHLDVIINTIRSIVAVEIRKNFMPRIMASVFIESSMNHKSLQCLKQIDSHGVLKGFNATSVCR